MRLSSSTTWRRNDYIAALAQGGYPSVISLTGRGRNMWLDSYLERILTRDVVDVSGRLANNRIDEVLRLIAANQSGELVKSRLADELSLPVSTIGTYLRALKTLYIIQDVKPWTANLTNRQIGRRKTFVADSALAMRLAGIRPQPWNRW